MLNPYSSLQLYKHEIRGYKRTATHYSFSKTMDGPLVPLTIENLHHVFQDNTAFIEKLDQTFKKDSQLYKFDNQSKQYLISSLYDSTTK